MARGTLAGTFVTLTGGQRSAAGVGIVEPPLTWALALLVPGR